MKKLYLVQHVQDLGNTKEVIRTIGIYSSEKKAKEVVEYFKKLPGFNVQPDDFYVDWYEINKDHWTEGFVTV